MLERAIPVPADPTAIGRALADGRASVLAFTASGAAYAACEPVELSTALDPEPGLGLSDRAPAPRWFGLIPYDACRAIERTAVHDRRPASQLSTPLWRRYSAVVEITREVKIIADSSRALDELHQRLIAGLERVAHQGSGPSSVALFGPVEPGAAHLERVARALEFISRGEIYQVNLARAFELAVEGSALELLARLSRKGRARFAAAFDWPELGVVSGSPELFLELDRAGKVRTSPIKGSRARGADPESDAALARELDADPKERAELAMVIDVERNDLGRVAEPGSVRLVEAPRVESHPGIHHRVATVEARLERGVSRERLLRATLPSGSVTGAPKIRAMQLIAELEPRRRGLYTGAHGMVRADGTLELAMAIRVLGFRGGRGLYFAGGGIVADSQPDRELAETLWKAEALVREAGGNAENWA